MYHTSTRPASRGGVTGMAKKKGGKKEEKKEEKKQ